MPRSGDVVSVTFAAAWRIASAAVVVVEYFGGDGVIFERLSDDDDDDDDDNISVSFELSLRGSANGVLLLLLHLPLLLLMLLH